MAWSRSQTTSVEHIFLSAQIVSVLASVGPREEASVTSHLLISVYPLYREGPLFPKICKPFWRKNLDCLLWSHGYPLDLFLLLGSKYHHWPSMGHVSSPEIDLEERFSRFLPWCPLFWLQNEARKIWDNTSVLSAFPDNLFLYAFDRWGDTEPRRHFTLKQFYCPFALLI